MPKNGFRLFQFLGITVYLHWSWLLVAAYEVQAGRNRYTSVGWNIAEYLALFAIVLMHEFGHALACRSVGGKADRIILWPLGGVAYVSPPMRPGAMLWSIVAGPLVNVLLIPVTIFFMLRPMSGDLGALLYSIALINVGLLIFNILPIYPLDGGKILWSLLWFVMGCGRALMVASVVGIIGAVALAGLALWSESPWLVIIALFAVWQAWIGVKTARELRRRENIPLRTDMACPVCKTPPPMGPFWVCSNCKSRFDAFEHPTGCPACGKPHFGTACMTCGARAPFAAWARTSSPPPPLPRSPTPQPFHSDA
jgi:Zn-dependent protease